MKKSISVSLGSGSLNHNDRKFITKNVDKSRTKDNVILENISLEKMYHDVFDPIVERYNQKQKRADRKIDDYLKHVQKSGNKESPFKEIVVQLGDRFNTHVGTQDAEIAKKVLEEYYNGFQDRNPNLAVFHAVIHMDEETPHLHLDFIPCGCGYKNGMEVRCSFSKSMENMGFATGGRSDIGATKWLENEQKVLSDIALEHGIERDEKGINRKHVHISEYKAQMERNEKIIEEMAKTSNLDVREPSRAIRVLAQMDEKEVIVSKAELNTLVEENAVLKRQNDLLQATVKSHEEKDQNLSEDAKKVGKYLAEMRKHPDYEDLRTDYEAKMFENDRLQGVLNRYEELLVNIHDSSKYVSNNYNLNTEHKSIFEGIANRIKFVFNRTKSDRELTDLPLQLAHDIADSVFEEQRKQEQAIQRQREMERSMEREEEEELER